jgi:hypothetical protein
MATGIERARHSLGDVLEKGMLSYHDSSRNRQKIIRANSILSRMGTIYSVYSMHHAPASSSGGGEKVGTSQP